jgi:hypothetical protein
MFIFIYFPIFSLCVVMSGGRGGVLVSFGISVSLSFLPYLICSNSRSNLFVFSCYFFPSLWRGMMGRGGIVSIGLRVDSMEMEKSGCALVRTSCG